MADVVQAGDMAGRVGATVGDQEQRLGVEVVLQELALLGDGRVVVVVAADDVSEEGHGAQVIDDGAQAGVDHLGVDAEVAMGLTGPAPPRRPVCAPGRCAAILPLQSIPVDEIDVLAVSLPAEVAVQALPSRGGDRS